MTTSQPTLRASYTLGEYARLTGQPYETVKSQARRGVLRTVQDGSRKWKRVTLETLEASPLWESILRRAQIVGALRGSPNARP